MIRSRVPNTRSSSNNRTYRSSRAVPPIPRRSKNAPSRAKWRLIKVILLVACSTLLVGILFSNEEETQIPAAQTPVSNGGADVSGAKVNEIVDTPKSSGSKHRSLARGVSGLPMEETPALVGASRGHVECDVDVDELVYWNEPQGQRDIDFKSPFATQSEKTKYITFEPDRGGWNNIRMNLENIFIFAAATGRTLVLPPASPLYLLNKDKAEKHKGFMDFFPLHTAQFQHRVRTITMEEFIKLEGGDDGQFPIPEEDREDVIRTAQECDKRAKSKIACDHITNYLEAVAYVPQFNSTNCIVFDEDMFETGHVSEENEAAARKFCKPRQRIYVTDQMQEEPLIHFKNKKGWRVMDHFYGYMYFTNPAIFNYYKRFVRDFLHYHDQIYCAAGKIVKSLQEDGVKLGFELDEEGGGGFSSMHVRRGDLQYKKVKIPAEEWYDNLKDVWKPNEIIYIATDERNKTFFDPIANHHNVKFLDDYWDFAGLGDLDGNYMGMIDTIIASRGRTFSGTFFSTFSGYINRMRGYHGMTMMDSYYGYLPKKTITHEFNDYYSGTIFSYEWPSGWIAIDGDKEPSREKF